jgi:hypothetical protein
MGRNILSVTVGVVLSFFATAQAGALLYQLSDRSPQRLLREVSRYLGDPVIAIVVGACVC